MLKLSALVDKNVYDVKVERDDGHFVVEVGENSYRVDARQLEGDFYSILSDNRSVEVSVECKRDEYLVRRGGSERSVVFTDPSRRGRDSKFAADGPEEVSTAMPGRVVRILVKEGDTVEADQGVIVVEAMKMENEIACSKAGTVKSIQVDEGQSVEGGAMLLVIE